MSNTAHVVEGEASESDSDIEIGKSPNSSMQDGECPKAFVIAGEAPESDDETKVYNQVNQSMSDVSIYSVRDEPLNPVATISQRNHASLLHQKLWECNVSLRATVECLLKHTTDLAADKLSRADSTLLNVQENMRATNANLSLARARLKQMQAGLEKANCIAAFPTVKPSRDP